MSNLIKWTTSRTNIVAVLLGLVTVWQSFEPFVSAELFALIASILTALVVFFRSNPRVK